MIRSMVHWILKIEIGPEANNMGMLLIVEHILIAYKNLSYQYHIMSQGISRHDIDLISTK